MSAPILIIYGYTQSNLGLRGLHRYIVDERLMGLILSSEICVSNGGTRRLDIIKLHTIIGISELMYLIQVKGPSISARLIIGSSMGSKHLWV